MSVDKSKVRAIINHHIILTMGAGAIPIPLADIAAVTAIQLEMLKSICEEYGADYSKKIGRSIIMSIAGNTLVRFGASFAKGIPGIGTLLGGGAQVILSGASTFAIAQAFVWHLDKSSNLEDFDVEEGKKIYKAEMEKGKEVAKSLKEEKEEETATEQTDAAEKLTENDEKTENKADIYEQLEKLGRLKETGVLTEEEFLREKEKLLDR